MNDRYRARLIDGFIDHLAHRSFLCHSLGISRDSRLSSFDSGPALRVASMRKFFVLNCSEQHQVMFYITHHH